MVLAPGNYVTAILSRACRRYSLFDDIICGLIIWGTEQSARSKSHEVSQYRATSIKVVDRHIIRRTHRYWQVCDRLAFHSKNLYNAANYYCRQHFFKCVKSLDLTKLYHLSKNSDGYRALPTKQSR